MSERRSLTPLLPAYAETRHFLRVLDGVSHELYRRTVNQVMDQRGTPQAQESWSEPSRWIPERLSGDAQALAWQIWETSGGALNPRYLRGHWYLSRKHELLTTDPTGTLRISERGRAFLHEPLGSVVAEIDEFEGILLALRLVAERGPARSGELLPEFRAFCQRQTRYQSDTSIKGALYDRLGNLLARDLVGRSGQTYEIADAGLSYLNQYARLLPGLPREAAALRQLARELRQAARAQLAEHLHTMDPYQFEHLIKFLLEEMGYTDVTVTSPSNDRGVDVLARIELGISSVQEVVQVKRYRGKTGRPVLDQLRGSLHRFDAVRGTIISTGDFTRGAKEAAFERGAAPITLIDRERLLDLLIEHEIGVTQQVVEYFQFDPSKLAAFADDEGDADEGDADEGEAPPPA